MKYNKIFAGFLGLGLLAFASCNPEPEFVTTDKGPNMTIQACPQAADMGMDLKFKVEINDPDFALSTLKVKLLFDETEVAGLTIRTKENGTYEDVLRVPMLKDIPDGTASLVFAAQNVGMGITSETRQIRIQRPAPAEVTLKTPEGQCYQMIRTGDYQYSLTENLPSKFNAFIQVPLSDGSKAVFGWSGDALVQDGENPVPFSAHMDGEYTLEVNLLKLSAAPFGAFVTVQSGLSEANKVEVLSLRQGIALKFKNIPKIDSWGMDCDFFTVDGAGNIFFNAVDGKYRFIANFADGFIKVEPLDAQGNTATIGEQCDGAVWMIGSQFGKPVVGPGWNTTDGAYAFAQIEPKLFRMTLNVGSQLNYGFSLKIFHQKDWGGEFVKANYAEFDGAGVFMMKDSGNIELSDGGDLAVGKAYQFLLDLSGGKNAAVLKVKEVDVASGPSLSITVNGVRADKITKSIYKVKVVELEKDGAISFTGIDHPEQWWLDPDHFYLDGTTLKFNAVKGFYSIELNLDMKYVTVRRVKENGKPGTYRDEGAITLMGWGVAHPVMTKQLAWDNGVLLTLAEVEPGKYQFSGIAVERGDATTMGGRICYKGFEKNSQEDDEAGISMKYFGQAGWGDEMGEVTFTPNATKLGFCQRGNIELMEGHELEKGAMYVMTFTFADRSLNGKLFNCTFDVQKK